MKRINHVIGSMSHSMTADRFGKGVDDIRICL